ncbi:MAG: flagellar hook-basal body complex protein [Chloroflexota bacterium]
MMRSLFSAISGLKGHQTMMDVVGNNISNVNTTAFKSGRITFQDIISQTLRGAQAPSATQGGLNPMQVGLGMQTGSLDMINTQGNLQSTGKPTDLAIQGDGFFQITDGTNIFYTRDGNFSTDSAGNLIHASTGMTLTPAVTVPAGATNLNIAQNGQVTWTVGATVTTGPIITMANFANPAGLTRVGGNMFQVSNNSGAATVGNPGTGGLGTIQAGFLEMSNVDLAAQFTNMIIAQRGFQANSRVITASDEILQDLVNIKR